MGGMAGLWFAKNELWLAQYERAVREVHRH
jgi:hypothetical protein